MQLFLVQASGPDHPGILSELMEPLVRHGASILDIAQSVIHDRLNLGVLIALPDATTPEKVRADTAQAGAALGLEVALLDISTQEYTDWVDRKGEPRHLLTVFGQALSPVQLVEVSRVAARNGLNVSAITRLSGRPSVEAHASSQACIELALRGQPHVAPQIRQELYQLAQKLECDIAFQVDDVFRRNRRLIAFDMDSTLIQTEVINELASAHGVEAEVAKTTEAAMNGELDFDQSLKCRLNLLKGLSTTVMEDIAKRLPLSPGAETLISTVKALGYKTVILSGGFTYFAEYLQKLLGIDYVHANELEIINDKLTGNVIGPIVNGQRKAELLRQIAEKEGIDLRQVIAVGDGANDLPMLSIAGLGVAYHAKATVKESAEHRICRAGLDGILYLLGVRDRDVADAQQ